jgi:NAD(P)-dependent dehydrogenase (short-subunit alcohol dehydrogenase family)
MHPSMATSVVVTGSTRGLGLGLADAFLALGCHVAVSGRGQPAVDAAVATLAAKHPRNQITGLPCDVTRAEQIGALWDAAQGAAGKVDLWVNNAGAGGKRLPLWEQRVEDVVACTSTNLLGTVLGTRIAIERMRAQGFGQVFNTEGFGSNGTMMRLGYAVYGATKTATRYFSRSVAKELGAGPVRCGVMMPGIVITEMLLAQFDGAPKSEWEGSRKLYSTLGNTVEQVAPVLARGMLENTKQNALVSAFSIPGVLFRFLNPRYRNRDLFKGLPEPRFKS